MKIDRRLSMYILMALLFCFVSNAQAEDKPWYVYQKPGEGPTPSARSGASGRAPFIQSVFVGHNYKKVNVRIFDYRSNELAKFEGYTDTTFFEIFTRDFIPRLDWLSFVVNFGYGNYKIRNQNLNEIKMGDNTYIEARYSYFLAIVSFDLFHHQLKSNRFDGLRVSLSAGFGDTTVRGEVATSNTPGGSTRPFYYEKDMLYKGVSVGYHYAGLIVRARYLDGSSIGDIIVDFDDSISTRESIFELAYQYEF